MLKIILSLMLLTSVAHAANIPALTILLQKNYNSLYEARNCGKNIERLVQAAHKNRIDLKNAYVLKIVGGGFFETSGFYTRGFPNDRAMLGYFHFVLVADNYVFDFDLHEPLVLPLEDYIRLQFTPQPSSQWMKTMAMDIPGWEMTRYEWMDYISYSNLNATWVKRMSEVVNVPKLLAKKRIR